MSEENFYGGLLRLTAYLRVADHIPSPPTRCRKRLLQGIQRDQSPSNTQLTPLPGPDAESLSVITPDQEFHDNSNDHPTFNAIPVESANTRRRRPSVHGLALVRTSTAGGLVQL